MKLVPFTDSLSSERSSLRLYVQKDNPDLEAAFRRFRRKLNQCNIIISRIQSENNQRHILEEKVRSEPLQTGMRELTAEESALHKEIMTVSSYLNFDIEDFFIHTKILLDRLLQILIHFIVLPDKARNDFAAHRLYLLKNTCSDAEYLEYIRENTNWFPLMLSVFRNERIVHDKTTDRSGSMSSLDGNKHTIFRAKVPNANQIEEIMIDLNKIKESHKDEISDIQNEDNIWQILKGLNQNAEKLTPDEVTILFNIQKKIGGDFPDVEGVITKIQNFLDFVGYHFIQKKS